MCFFSQNYFQVSFSSNIVIICCYAALFFFPLWGQLFLKDISRAVGEHTATNRENRTPVSSSSILIQNVLNLKAYVWWKSTNDGRSKCQDTSWLVGVGGGVGGHSCSFYIIRHMARFSSVSQQWKNDSPAPRRFRYCVYSKYLVSFQFSHKCLNSHAASTCPLRRAPDSFWLIKC